MLSALHASFGSSGSSDGQKKAAPFDRSGSCIQQMLITSQERLQQERQLQEQERLQQEQELLLQELRPQA